MVAQWKRGSCIQKQLGDHYLEANGFRITNIEN